MPSLKINPNHKFCFFLWHILGLVVKPQHPMKRNVPLSPLYIHIQKEREVETWYEKWQLLVVSKALKIFQVLLKNTYKTRNYWARVHSILKKMLHNYIFLRNFIWSLYFYFNSFGTFISKSYTFYFLLKLICLHLPSNTSHVWNS